MLKRQRFWNLGNKSWGRKIKQVPSYRYLGTLFMDSNIWGFYYQAQKK